MVIYLLNITFNLKHYLNSLNIGINSLGAFLSLSRAGLLGNSFLSPLYFIFIHKIVIFQWNQILIEFKHKWNSCWNVVRYNVFFTYSRQMFYYCSKRIAMGNNYYVFVVKDGWADGVMPKR